jgi:hypothetical protein
VLIRLRGLFVARLIDQPQILEAGAAVARINHPEQVGKTVSFARHPVPKLLVTSAPEIPRVAAFDLILRKFNASIHRLEHIECDFRQILWFTPVGEIG